MKKNVSFGTGRSVVVTTCQTCGNQPLAEILFLGYLPPVNKLPYIGSAPSQQPSYPAQLLYCKKCNLVQLGLIVDPMVLFPKEYPYTSGTTKVLRDNFADLYRESSQMLNLKPSDLIVDIGSNDGTLLGNFRKHKVLGITPEDIGKIAVKNGIPTLLEYFTKNVAQKVKKQFGKAKLVTAANVFAHIENVHDVLKSILIMLDSKGVFISESHYLLPLIKAVQYDTIYHEHLRYYSLHSLKYLLNMHNLEIFHVKEIPSHGGSIRVYAARKNLYPIYKTVAAQLKKERDTVVGTKSFTTFRYKTIVSKLSLNALLYSIKKRNKKIYGISAPSRASTLINYTGLDDGILDCVLEVQGSYKIGKYIPGTLIPILDEKKLFEDQPPYALILSWHIAEEIMPKLKSKGYKGDFIVPLPTPHIILNKSIKI